MKSVGELVSEVFVGLWAFIQLLFLLLVIFPVKIVLGILGMLFKGFGDDLKSWRIRWR